MAATATTTKQTALRQVRAGAHQEAVARRAAPARPAAKPKPALVVVPRGRRTIRFAAVAFGIVFTLMLGLTVFQTRLAEEQLEIDRAEDGVELARSRFAELRKENAALRSPERIAEEAAKLGLVPGRSAEFITVDPAVVTAVAIAAGDGLDPGGIGGSEDPFEAHKAVKRVVSGEGE